MATPVITASNWSDALDPSFQKMINTWQGPIPQEIEKYYSVKNTTLAEEKILMAEDGGAAEPFTGQIGFDKIKQGNSKTITMEEFAKGAAIQYKLIKTQQVNAVESILKALSQALPLCWIAAVYDWANLGFSTFTVADGHPLFYASHSSKSTSAVQANLGSTAMSYASVDATAVAMRKFNSPAGNPQFDKGPNVIWCGIDLESYAGEIVGSRGKPDGQTNNTNFYYGKFDVWSSRVISDTNNWGMLNRQNMKEAMMWRWVEKNLQLRDRELSSLVSRYVKYSFFGKGCADPFWAFGHSVS